MRSRGRQRGAVIVEVALVIPLLIMLTMGMAEVGFIVRDTQTVVAASQAGTRSVATAGDTRLADSSALSSMAAALNDFDPNDVERIIIFKPEADGSMPILCQTAAVNGLCNYYDGSDLSLTAADFTGSSNCNPTAPDAPWCPIDRETSQGVGPDWIGIRVEVKHESFAPFMGDRTISDTTIMRLEPRFEP